MSSVGDDGTRNFINRNAQLAGAYILDAISCCDYLFGDRIGVNKHGQAYIYSTKLFYSRWLCIHDFYDGSI